MADKGIPMDVSINSNLQGAHPESLSPIERERKRKFGKTSYKPEFADMVFNLLSRATTAKNKSHCCALLQCSKSTLLRWAKKNPEFHKAIEDGLEIGKSKWYSKLATHAFKPSVKVNNGLIKLLSSNVYGIKEDQEQIIIHNHSAETDPEKIMKDRGIPVPEVDIDDIEDIEEE